MRDKWGKNGAQGGQEWVWDACGGGIKETLWNQKGQNHRSKKIQMPKFSPSNLILPCPFCLVYYKQKKAMVPLSMMRISLHFSFITFTMTMNTQLSHPMPLQTLQECSVKFANLIWNQISLANFPHHVVFPTLALIPWMWIVLQPTNVHCKANYTMMGRLGGFLLWESFRDILVHQSDLHNSPMNSYFLSEIWQCHSVLFSIISFTVCGDTFSFGSKLEIQSISAQKKHDHFEHAITSWSMGL